MIEQLLALSQVGAGEGEHVHHYSLEATLKMLLASFQPLLDSKALTLEQSPFEDAVLSMRRDSLETILTNLLSNAVKYTPEGGHITIAVGRRHGQVEIAITDTGIGIDTKDKTLVFERFSRPMG